MGLVLAAGLLVFADAGAYAAQDAGAAMEPPREDCGQGAECKPPPAPEPVTGNPHPADAPPLTLTSAGLGGLNAESAFRQSAIEKAFPGFTVRKTERFSEGMSEIVYHVLKAGKPVAVISGEELIDSIQILSPVVAGPAGVRIGDALAGIRKKLRLEECFRGVEEEAESVTCSEKGSNIGFWFAFPMTNKREPDVLHPRMLPQDAKLQSILWYRM